MIDKIVFYINDVDFDVLEKRIPDLDVVGLDRIRGISKYGATLKNAITIIVDGKNKLIGHGSLHKFAKGNNYSTFTGLEAHQAILELGNVLGISLERIIITSIEIGVNMQMTKEPMKYIDIIRSFKKGLKRPFIYMKPLAKSSQIRGVFCRFTEYEIKFYDKTFEATHYLEGWKKALVPLNTLRYEIQLFPKKYSEIGFKALRQLTADKLTNQRYYPRFIRILRKIFAMLNLDDVDKNYTGKLPEDVKMYIFTSSESYRFYLDYLEKYDETKKEYNKGKKLQKSLKKEFAPLKETGNIIELKSKFAEAIELVSYPYTIIPRK